MGLDQQLANFLYKGPDRKYLGLQITYSVFYYYLTLL